MLTLGDSSSSLDDSLSRLFWLSGLLVIWLAGYLVCWFAGYLAFRFANFHPSIKGALLAAIELQAIPLPWRCRYPALRWQIVEVGAIN